ncbi:hypothetical protein AUW26_28585 [Streptomyces sp. CC71]|nr:hypothetical protein AUW26_28585 [Streptomyces sp. CC71]
MIGSWAMSRRTAWRTGSRPWRSRVAAKCASIGRHQLDSCSPRTADASGWNSTNLRKLSAGMAVGCGPTPRKSVRKAPLVSTTSQRWSTTREGKGTASRNAV